MAAVPVLVVDDNAAKRLALRAVLAPLGYSIVEAASGQAALRRILAQDFAVILLDVCMPTMDGFETAALIRLRRQSEMTPIIFITAYGTDDLVTSDRYAEGAVDFMFAPVRPEELRAKVSVFANLYLKARHLASRAQEAQTSAAQLRLLTDAAPVGIFQTDPQNRYIYTNPRWTEITGITAADATGRDWDSILKPDQRAEMLAGLADAAVLRDEIRQRFEIDRPGADPRIVLLTSNSVPDRHGSVTGWVGTLADVTAEAGAEAALAEARDHATTASQLKSDFLANMSHEIRTPMNGVIGMADLLLETDLDPRQRDYAQTVRNSGEALLTIINEILDFSKVEAGKLEIERIEFDLRRIVADVVDLLAIPAQAKGLELVPIVADAVPGSVTGDPGRVRQVLTNLIGNAIKFTQAGEIVVRVTEADPAGGGGGRGDLIHFEVSDTGDGIAVDKLGQIFQPFVQADASTSRRYGGTGLGLAISSQLVALMGGDCGVTSALGVGSAFWFTAAMPADGGRAAYHPPEPDADLAGIPALIVDDSATQRRVLSACLEAWGMDVTAVASGATALTTLQTAAIHARPFAVALVDRSMGGMDGLQLSRAIRDDLALLTPVVLMTPLGQDRNLAGEPGVTVALPKPLHREDLHSCLRAALGLDAPAVSPRTAATPTGTGTGRLLLAEDNLINQKIAVAILSRAGYAVDTVLDGAAAVHAVTTNAYDAILMDCHMPGLNGYEATAAIRAQEGSDRHIPIIAMTAAVARQDHDRRVPEGMDGYLTKPVSKDTLLAAVARSLRMAPA